MIMPIMTNGPTRYSRLVMDEKFVSYDHSWASTFSFKKHSRQIIVISYVLELLFPFLSILSKVVDWFTDNCSFY